MTDIAHPLRIDGSGRTARADRRAHVRDLIELVLFTTPGERVNRPTFGGGIQRLLFDANSPEVAAATRFQVQAALQDVLGDVIRVERVDARSEESTLTVTVVYSLRDGERRVETFRRSV